MNQNNKIKFGIFPKVLLAMVFVSAIPLLVIWYVNYSNTIERIDSEVDSQFRTRVEFLTHHVDSWVDMNRRMLHENAMLPQIRSMIADQQNPILEIMTGVYDWNYLAFTVDPDGQNVGRSDGKPPKYYGDRIYVKQVLQGNPMGKQVLIGKTSGKPALVLSVPIKADGGDLKGVLAIAMTIAEVSERITSTRIGTTGYAFLVDDEGKVIAHPSQNLTNTRQDLSADPAVAAALSNSAEILVFDDTGTKVIARMQRTKDDWILVVRQEYDEAFSAVAETNRNSGVLLIATLVVVFIVAVVFSRRLSVPVLKLAEFADALSHGKLDATVDEVSRSDEIGSLANAIVRLGASIRLAMERLNRRAKKR